MLPNAVYGYSGVAGIVRKNVVNSGVANARNRMGKKERLAKKKRDNI